MAQIVTAKNGQTNGIEYPRTVKSALLNDDGTPLNPLTQTNIINDLTTGGETNVLSAEQGVILNSAIGQTTTLINERMVEEDILITVGENGDFEYINSAITDLTRKKVRYKRLGIKAEIRLLSGCILNEQVIVDGLDLGWITITSEDAEVEIDRQRLTGLIQFPSYDGGQTLPIVSRGAFIAINNATLPTIGVLFNMNNTGTNTNYDGIIVCNNSSALILQGCGVKNAGSKGLYVLQGSSVTAMGTIFSGAGGAGIGCFRGSTVAARGVDVSGAGSHGIYADSSSRVEALKANIQNCSEIAVYADSNSLINANYADLSGAASDGVRCLRGATVDVSHAIINNVGSSGIRCDGGRVAAENVTILNATIDGIRCNNAASVHAGGGTVTGAGSRGLYATLGGLISAYNCNARKTEDVDNNDDIRVAVGGIISAQGAIGGMAGTANTISVNGIIWRNV